MFIRVESRQNSFCRPRRLRPPGHNKLTIQNAAIASIARFLLVAVLLGGMPIARSWSQQSEKLFVGAPAYNPIPSPDGLYVAYVITGHTLDGTEGFGRSHTRSEIAFVKADGTNKHQSGVSSFLSDWLPDGKTVASFRDYQFGLVGLAGTSHAGTILDLLQGRGQPPAERAVYLATKDTFAWIEHHGQETLLQTTKGPIATFPCALALSSVLSPSPDGRYLAIASQGPYRDEEHKLWVFDLEKMTWADLGAFTIHPDPNWDYNKPSWNPWFPDSNRLTFISGDVLRIVRPDGKDPHDILRIKNGGLATVSPQGDHIAYATFTPHPSNRRADLDFWGDTILWAVSAEGGLPSQVTRPSESGTLTLRWLNQQSLIFDRVSGTLHQDEANIWTVSLATK